MSNTILTTLVNSNVSSAAEEMGPPHGPRVGVEGIRGAASSAHDMLGTLHAAIGWETLAIGLLAAMAIAVIGSAIPAWFISKIRPAEVMRAE
jgi:ABC-type antimicrobial peptide transport system permease subunit